MLCGDREYFRTSLSLIFRQNILLYFSSVFDYFFFFVLKVVLIGYPSFRKFCYL